MGDQTSGQNSTVIYDVECAVRSPDSPVWRTLRIESFESLRAAERFGRKWIEEDHGTRMARAVVVQRFAEPVVLSITQREALLR